MEKKRAKKKLQFIKNKKNLPIFLRHVEAVKREVKRDKNENEIRIYLVLFIIYVN